MPRKLALRAESPLPLATNAGDNMFRFDYSPAFLRNLAQHSAVGALRILSRVYEHARRLWPATAEQQGVGVTVYVDALKACADIEKVRQAYAKGEFWTLTKRGESEAAVEKRLLSDLPGYGGTGDAAKAFEVLPLWPANECYSDSW